MTRLLKRGFGTSGNFNGLDRYVLIPATGTATALQLTGAQTWVGWFTINTRAQSAPAAMARRSGTTAATSAITILLDTPQIVVSLCNGTTSTSFTSASTYNDARWHMYCAVYNPTVPNLTLYVDGAVDTVFTTSVPSAINSAALPVYIGCAATASAPSNFLRALLDEMAIFNYALAATQAQAIYYYGIDAYVNAGQNGPVGWWRFDEGTGTAVANSGTGGGLAANLCNGVWQGASLTDGVSTWWDNNVPMGGAPNPLTDSGFPPPVGAVFPTLSTATSGSYSGVQSQVFALFNPLGQSDPDGGDFTTSSGNPGTGWAAKLQWCDYVKTTQYPNGAVLWYPWGNSRISVRKPYGALVFYEKPRASPTQAQAAADFGNTGTGAPPVVTGGVATLGNWRYVNLPKLLAAAPWAYNIGGFGGGLLDYVRNDGTNSPRYCYLPGENGVPNTASTNNPAYTQKNSLGVANNTAKGDNPVMLRIDTTADLKTAAAYTSINLPQMMYNAYHMSPNAAPTNVYGSGGSIADYVDNLGGHFGGGGHKGGAVANGRIYFSPTLNLAGKVGGLSITVPSVDVTAPGNFTDATKWYWMDFRNRPAGAGTFTTTFLTHFGGFQGIVVCQKQGGVVGKDVVYFVASSLPYMYQLDTSVGPGGKTDNTGKTNVAANPAAWKYANTQDIWAAVDTDSFGQYLNGAAITAYDPDGTPYDAIIFCPFSPHLTDIVNVNKWILLYDTRKDFADTTAVTGAWRKIKTTSIALNDPNMATYTAPVNYGYQAAIQDNSGYVWLMPAWNEVSVPPSGGHQSAWLCWNPLYPFDDASSWKTYPSYAPTHFDTSQLTIPIWNCGLAFDYDVNALFPAVYGGGYPGTAGGFPDLGGTRGSGTAGIAVQLMPDVMANQSGVPPH